MDTVTQFLLGASLSGALLGRELGARALMIGGAVAVLPDLDVLIPYGDPLDALTHHRGFSHSLIIQTLAAPPLSGLIAALDRRAREQGKLLLLTVWLALITHSLLDALTTYGTQLLWPLEAGPPFAYPAVFIVDPVYSGLLLGGVLAVFLGRNKGSGLRANRLLLLLSTLYLGAGMISHWAVASRAEAHPAFAGKKIHVQPAPLGIMVWQVLGVDEASVTAGLATVASCGISGVVSYPRLERPPESFQPSAAVRRYEWFTGGFFTYEDKGTRIAITDLRIGYPPAYAFSFDIARRGSEIEAISPEAVGGAGRDPAWLLRLYAKAWRSPGTCGFI